MPNAVVQEDVTGRISEKNTKALKIASLTSLRFFAAALIVLRHYSESRGWGIEKTFALDQGVCFFFVLSGFVLFYTYRDKLSSRSDLIHFALVRVARIWPVYLLGLLLLLMFLPANLPHSPSIALTNVFLLQSWVPQSTFYYALNAPSWSLSVEFFFYAAFPLLLWNWNKNWIYKIAGAMLLTTAIIAFCGYLHWHGTHTPTHLIYQSFLYINPLSRLFEFVLGMTAAHIFLRIQQNRLSRVSVSLIEVMLIIGIAINLFLAGWCVTNFANSPFAYWMMGSSGVVLYASLIVIFALREGFISRCLSARAFVFLGEISYSVFVFHWILLQIMSQGQSRFAGGGWSEFPLYCVILLLISSASFYIIEQPARRLARRLTEGFFDTKTARQFENACAK
jgi:peptidoglycan/LPS O-acetylase OafA/YrhL